MAADRPARRPPLQLTHEEIAEGFGRITARQWRAKEARPFVRRLKAVPGLAAPFLIDRLAGGDRERELAAALLGELQGPRVIAPLRDLLRDRAASSAARIAAAAVLEGLGDPAPIHVLAGAVPDPEALLGSVWESILERAQAGEAFREQFLASFEDDDPESQSEVLNSLAETRDARALALLVPLLSSRRAATVLAAVGAIDALGAPEGAPSLHERAKSDPDARVRRQAREAYGRLLMRANPLLPEMAAVARPAPAPPPALPVHRACVTLIDRYGDQAILVSRRRPDGFLKVVTILVGEGEGVKACFGVDMMNDDELGEIGQELASNGLTPVEVDLPHCRELLAEARRATIGRRRRPPMELEIWRGIIEAPGEGPPAQVPLWPEDEAGWMEHLPKTAALLSTPEFRQWYFEPGMVWPYVDEWSGAPLEAQQGEQGQRTLDALVRLAAADLIKTPQRELLGQRLKRQSRLLGRLGKREEARLAAAAAKALDPHDGIPVEHHPFVRAMVLSSFFNAGLRPPHDFLTTT